MPAAPPSAAHRELAERAHAFLKLDPDGARGGLHAIAERWRAPLERWLAALPQAAAQGGDGGAALPLIEALTALLDALAGAPPAPQRLWAPASRWPAEHEAALPPTPTLPAPALRLQLRECDTDLDSERARQRRRYQLCERDPWRQEGATLALSFALRRSPAAGSALSQRRLCAEAEARLLAILPAPWADALRRPHPSGGTILARHLQRFTTQATEDRFVEPGLEARLIEALRAWTRRALAEATDDAQALASWRRARALEALAEPLIRWRGAQERLRVRLLEAPPRVTRSECLVSLALLPEALQRQIAALPAQRAQWAERYKNEAAEGGFLVDTHALPPDLRHAVRAHVPHLRGPLTRGEVYLGENASALRLLQARWAGRVDLTYIDPPYNTGGAKFAYRDMYQSDTWLTMMQERLELARRLSAPTGALTLSIDDAELVHASTLATRCWGPELAKLVWDRNRKNDARYFSVGHEYMLVHAADLKALRASGRRLREPKPGIDEARARFLSLRAQHGEDWEAIRAGWLAWFRALPAADPRRRLRRYTKVGPRGPYRDDGNVNWPGGGGPRYEVLHPETGRPCKQPRSGWRYPTPERFWEEVEAGRVVFGEDEATVPRVASYLFEGEGQVMPSVFYSYAQTAAQEFDAMFGARVFRNPKPWRDLARVLRYLGEPDASVLDFFAGSGSTGHAVLHLNRVDGGQRRFILVERGAHGERVLLPRLAKAAYADAWADGAPQEPSPTPTLIHVLYLQTPEDVSLNLSDAPPLREGALRFLLRDAPLPQPLIRRPWSWSTRVTRGGLVQESPVDWVESLNQRVGIEVTGLQRPLEGLEIVRGALRDAEPLVIAWCDRARVTDAALVAALADIPVHAHACYVNGGVPEALPGWRAAEALL